MILDEKPSKLVHTFLNQYASLFPIDKQLALKYIKNQEKFDELTNRWYECLDANDLASAYQVYNDDYYFTDLWTCFVRYSRGYLRNVRKYMFITNERIIDLGCGIGYTTAALKQTYPNADVYGSNIMNTKQWTFCESMAKHYNFNMLSEIPARFDRRPIIVFASEYFEHIHDPLQHLRDIIDNLSPDYFIIANAFNTRSIGHFTEYNGIDQSKMSRTFNQMLRSFGYTKEKMPFFNNKPNVWRKS